MGIPTCFPLMDFNRFFLGIVAKNSNLAKSLGQMVHMSQKFIIVFIKKMINNTTLCGKSNAW